MESLFRDLGTIISEIYMCKYVILSLHENQT